MNMFLFNVVRFVVKMVLSRFTSRTIFIDSNWTGSQELHIGGLIIGNEDCYVMTHDCWFIATRRFSLVARSEESGNYFVFMKI
jgi:hypothetical protein